MDKYELVKDIGSGNFGVARLMRNKETKELVAMKYIERGPKVYEFCKILFFLNFLLVIFQFEYWGYRLMKMWLEKSLIIDHSGIPTLFDLKRLIVFRPSFYLGIVMCFWM